MKRSFQLHHRGGLRPQPASKASALVVSLAFVVIITILVVGFATTARMERSLVESHAAKVQAGLFGAMGADIAAARIRTATATNVGWVSQPGRIAYGLTGTTAEFVTLNSGTATLPLTPDVSVDLNPPTLISGGGVISEDATLRLPVKWIYVRENGSLILDPAVPPAYATGPSKIVGRFAFWTDDLSARINLNAATATSTNVPAPASWPGHQNLTNTINLSASTLISLQNYRTNAHFESVRDANLAVSGSSPLRAALADHKMDLTHFSSSPNLNVFGEPKIVLTTKASRTNGTGSTNFFDILNSPGADPGLNASIDATKFNALFHKLLNTYMRRTDWPLMPGKSFVDKYGNQVAAQIVLNLIDYVRSAEAEKLIVEPSRGHFDGGSIFAYGAAGPTIIGNTRRFYATQMGVWISDPDPTGACNVRVYTEVFLPKSAGDAATKLDLLEGNRAIITHIGYNGSVLAFPKNGVDVIINDYGDIRGGTGPKANRAKMAPGEFRTIEISYGLTSTNFVRPTGNLDIRNTIRAASLPGNSIDFAPLPYDFTPGAMVTYPLNPPGISPANALTAINTVGVNDPVINKAHGDWVQTGANTLGVNGKTAPPLSTLGQAPSGVPQQDADASGNLTDVGFGIPAYKGTSKNPRGMVESLAELGRIHTGNKGTMSGGVPWRTLRIQPRVSSDTSLPDWLLLDLFAVPGEASGMRPSDAAILHPAPSTVGGRVNVNAQIAPTNWAVTRTQPLLSVLTANVTGTSLPSPQSAATNIIDGTLAIGSNPGRWYGGASFTNTRLFFLPAQIAEIKGIADGGEASEAQLANILPFLTTRSSAFAVYSVGQKIRQLPSGKIQVLGESRSLTLLERESDGTLTKRSTADLGL